MIASDERCCAENYETVACGKANLRLWTAAYLIVAGLITDKEFSGLIVVNA
jgi:hypothetical protein